jgi:Papain family cysteine protease
MLTGLSPAGRRYPVTRSIRKPEEVHLAAVTYADLKDVPLEGAIPAKFYPPVWDQGQEGDCTANGGGAVYEIQRRTQGLPAMDPSRPFIYDLTRAKEGTPLSEDAGAMVPDIPAVLAVSGCCDLSLFPVSMPDFATAPDATVMAAASLHKVGTWARPSHTPESLVAVLAQGYAVMFGFDVYSSFESAAVASTGIVPVPASGEQNLGGHCMALVGWSITAPAGPHKDGLWGWFQDRMEGSVPEDGYFVARNSWGTNWGLGGYCHFPFAMFRRGFAYDPCIIQTVLG